MEQPGKIEQLLVAGSVIQPEYDQYFIVRAEFPPIAKRSVRQLI